MTKVNLMLGNCLDKLKDLEDNSVDSIVTDPPYGLSFMGKKWDYDVPSVAIWKECLRVLKPGAMLLSFAGSRTYHRMACNIEDAGFEIRDQIMWIYGSGFPKSHNIGKAVDKLEGNDKKVVGIQKGRNSAIYGGGQSVGINDSITKGTSNWEGWGTALKPAHEPIVVARKPLGEKTVALNVLKWGTGGINIDGCRVETNDNLNGGGYSSNTDKMVNEVYGEYNKMGNTYIQPQGRFPANIILDEEAGKILDEQSGVSNSQGGNGKSFNNSMFNTEKNNNKGDFHFHDKGGASRFFYCPKASKKDRNEGCEELETKIEVYPGINTFDKDGNRLRADGSIIPPLSSKNNHPTVKPTKLMQYLVRLVTPKGATCLDPFMGSGSTGKACMLEDVNFIGIEMNEEYMEIAKKRIGNLGEVL